MPHTYRNIVYDREKREFSQFFDRLPTLLPSPKLAEQAMNECDRAGGNKSCIKDKEPTHNIAGKSERARRTWIPTKGFVLLGERLPNLQALLVDLQRLLELALRSLSLFGSVARGVTEMDSDIDLAAEFDPAARMDLLQLSAVDRRIAELLGSPVDLLPEPVEKRRLQDQINRDRRRAFYALSGRPRLWPTSSRTWSELRVMSQGSISSLRSAAASPRRLPSKNTTKAGVRTTTIWRVKATK
jgi:predicted nucleotidyltransferase